ncbi:MAG: permease-like cell division protein FtsX [Armatimonadota bacterium]|nr:permease-like cell division protein FtsX [Armatimonadota bacterium]MDW8155149.1 permease-like cell division protein FtsX [Armatimonadota bacterium]
MRGPARLSEPSTAVPEGIPQARPHLRAVLSSAAYLTGEGAVGFWRNGLMSMAAVSAIVAALLAFGGAVVSLWNLEALALRVEAQLVAVAYLREDLSPAQREAARRAAAAIPEVRAVSFVPREQALRRLEEALGGVELAAAVSKNPLPDTLEVYPNRAQDLPRVAEALRSVPYVADVTHGGDATERVLALTRLVRGAGAAVTLAMGAVSVVVSANALRLTVLARKEEVEIMRLVGATSWFVRWPFLVEGLLQGLVAAACASAFWTAFYPWAVARLQQAWPFLPVLPTLRVVPLLVAWLVAAGAFVGLLGAAVSLRRFLAK